MLMIAGFIFCATIIFLAGKKLSFYGDLLAEKTGMSKGWIGLILMSTVTSLPELMVGISSSAIVQSPDLAAGDIFGSCAFNLGILAMLDAFIPGKKSLSEVASPTHMLNAALSILLIALAGLALFLPKDIYLTPWIGISSIIFILVYFVSIRIIYKNELNHPVRDEKNNIQELIISLTLRQIIVRYTALALVIICAALALPYFAEHIAEMSGLKASFVGTFFLALSTSLPEVAVSLAAIRSGSIDMAVGNLLGSNIFNVFILAIDDLFYTNGLLLKDASDIHMVSAFSVIIMTAIVIIGLSYKAKGKRFLLAWDAFLIFMIYILNLVLLAFM
jgi:cation:H+ antiporter